ncbi:MAG: single-stranded-DNA-specific exonuclease RecJ [candidate division WOR-3 bacterium]|nr:single-stranded-DNA-specific exonuclease RecJ [candidate division WOR-3 bacterium]
MKKNNSFKSNQDYIWVVSRSQEQNENIACLAQELKLPKFIVSILYDRGYETYQQIYDFLNPSLANLHQPKLLTDMEKAVSRIIQCIEKKQPILIYGDYDVDGVSGSALLLRVLRLLGAQVSFYIPHRQKEGYGLSDTGVLYAKSYGFNLIITVDCGTTDFSEIEMASKMGIDVIVCDHHEPKEVLPKAYAIINPKRHDSIYPFRELAGVGVAFKLAWALLASLNQPKEYLVEHLDLVALGTIADIVPLIDENRVLAKFGLKQIVKSKKVGLQALLKVAGLSKREITPYDVGFILAPRINASGRISCAEKAVRLLITDEQKEAELIAHELNQENAQRQNMEMEILNSAIEIIEQKNIAENRVMVLANEAWHEGVVGIGASRLVDRYFRPTILLTIKEDRAKGSGRSIPGFNLYQALKSCQDSLLSFGGHKYACGVLLAKDKIDEFAEKIQIYAQENLPDEFLQRKLYIDGLISLHEITPELLKIIQKFEPFGQENPCPVFMTSGLEVVGYPRVVGQEHLKFSVRENKDKVLEAIAFGRSDVILKLQKGKENHLDIVYTFDEHCFAGKTKIQLVIKDMKIH